MVWRLSIEKQRVGKEGGKEHGRENFKQCVAYQKLYNVRHKSRQTTWITSCLETGRHSHGVWIQAVLAKKNNAKWQSWIFLWTEALAELETRQGKAKTLRCQEADALVQVGRNVKPLGNKMVCVGGIHRSRRKTTEEMELMEVPQTDVCLFPTRGTWLLLIYPPSPPRGTSRRQ